MRWKRATSSDLLRRAGLWELLPLGLICVNRGRSGRLRLTMLRHVRLILARRVTRTDR